MPKKKENKSVKPSTEKRSISLKTKLLFFIGSIFILIPLFFYVNEGVQLAFFTPKVTPVKNVYAIPTKIIIPQVHVDLPIRETAISHGIWDIAEDAISHLTISADPSEKGVIILYGHNTNDRFGPIRWLSVGQKITLMTKDKKAHHYTITATKDVSANDVSVLTSVHTETLILYTCDGFADLQRFVVIAKPKN